MQYLARSKHSINGIYKTGYEGMGFKFGLKHKRRRIIIIENKNQRGVITKLLKMVSLRGIRHAFPFYITFLKGLKF